MSGTTEVLSLIRGMQRWSYGAGDANCGNARVRRNTPALLDGLPPHISTVVGNGTSREALDQLPANIQWPTPSIALP